MFFNDGLFLLCQAAERVELESLVCLVGSRGLLRNRVRPLRRILPVSVRLPELSQVFFLWTPPVAARACRIAP